MILGFIKVSPAIEDTTRRAETLAALAHWLVPSERERVLRATLDAARSMSDPAPRAQVLAHVVPRLAGSLFREVLDSARVVGDEGQRAETLADVVPRLPGSLALEARRGMDDWVAGVANANANAAIPPDGSGMPGTGSRQGGQ